MNRDIKQVNHYLKNVDLAAPASPVHRDVLRRQVRNEMDRRQIVSKGKRAWRVALAVAIVAGAGALAIGVGVKVYRYHFEGRDAEGSYVFATDPEVIREEIQEGPDGTETHVTVTQTRVSMRPDDNEGTSVEQMQAVLEEVDQLRREGARRLLRVIDRQVGEGFLRVCVFEYELSDGRTMEMGENVPNEDPAGLGLTDSQRSELSDAAEAGAGEILGTYDEQIEGQVITFERRRFVLGDGTEVIQSEGTP